MIIRPKLKYGFVLLPNALLNDKRLSADTRAMIAVLLSKPRGWQLRPKPLCKLLSREGAKEIGWTKLRRMLSEAEAAGYIARSEEQRHEDDGTWGKYEYIVGMPADVRHAVEAGQIGPRPRQPNPQEGEPHTVNDFTNHKEKTSERTESTNFRSSPCLLPTLGRKRKGHSREDAHESAPRRPERPETVQHRLATRLGNGDAGAGWLLLDFLSPSRRDQLTAMERLGNLREAELREARAVAELARASNRVGPR